jgi:hypothetical protein
MNNKVVRLASRLVAIPVLVVSMAAMAQHSPSKEFKGVIDAYSPQTTAAPSPYEIHGPWSLKLKPSGKADFYAALNMELSDGWVLTQGNGNFDPSGRGAHTHHISFADGEVTQLANGGFEVTGMATITLNGGSAPVSPSTLVVQITGGTEVEFSNITLTFQPPGAKHFGSEPLPGVIRSIENVK